MFRPGTAVYLTCLLRVFSPKDLDALLQKNKSLEEESENLAESVAEQKEKYQHLQVWHMFNSLTSIQKQWCLNPFTSFTPKSHGLAVLDPSIPIWSQCRQD